jgi:fido (protein-threonine AMPylation protein)
MTCPAWSDDKDEHSAPACFSAIKHVVVRACAAAQAAIPRRRDLVEWHRSSFQGLAPLDYYAGGLRQVDPRRPCLAQNVGVQPYMGSHFHHVLLDTEQLCEFIVRELSTLEVQWSGLADADRIRGIATIVGVAIGRFIHIHPFMNGNGRMSRVLWTVLLARLQLPRHLSIVKRPPPPYDQVMAEAMQGNYGPAVALVLQALNNGPVPPTKLPAPKRP